MVSIRQVHQVAAVMGCLLTLAGISAGPASAQEDPRVIQQRRMQQQQAQPQAAPQEDPRVIQQRRMQQQQRAQPPAAPPVFVRPNNPQVQQGYRPPPQIAPYGRSYGGQQIYRPQYEPPVQYQPAPRYYAPRPYGYEVDDEPVYQQRRIYVAPRAYAGNSCRIVNKRVRGRLVAVRECRVCGPTVVRNRYGQRYTVNRCTWVRR